MTARAAHQPTSPRSALSISGSTDLLFRVRRAIARPGRAVGVSFRRLASRLHFGASCRKLGVDETDRRDTPPAYTLDLVNSIADDLLSANVRVEPVSVSAQHYLDFVREVDYRRNYPDYLSYYRGAIEKKVLEQYLTLKATELGEHDVLMDVAAEVSPFLDIASRMTGSVGYKQDLSFRPGLHRNRVGSFASSIPLADGALTAMSVHCSLEHFQGEEDTGFIREAARLLRRGGQLFIVPLYIWPQPLSCFDPYLAQKHSVPLDEGSTRIPLWNYGNRFIRYYSPESLQHRIIAPARPHFDTRILVVTDYQDLDPLRYVAFALHMTRK